RYCRVAQHPAGRAALGEAISLETGYFRRSTADEVAGLRARHLGSLARRLFCGVQNFIPTEPNAGITTVVPGRGGVSQFSSEQPCGSYPQHSEGLLWGF